MNPNLTPIEQVHSAKIYRGIGMYIYSIIMFITSAIFLGLGIAVYRGRTDLIHDYHQTKVTDRAAYGKAFGKALLVIAGTMLLSGIIGLSERFAVPTTAVLMIGLCIGIGCIVAVQRKYNKGVF